MERGLYNGFLSGVSLDGKRFLYENPLSTDGSRHHEEWFLCPCCPPNVARVLASIGNYFYSTENNADLWVHLFASNRMQVELNGQAVQIEQQTLYPWDGTVQIKVTPARPQTFTLHLRVPGWCQHFKVAVNGVDQPVKAGQAGYVAISREWQPGDSVTYVMDMPIQPVWANPAVRQLEGRVALQRGPIVYCLEGVDHGNLILDKVSVNPQDISGFTHDYHPELLGGVTVINGKGQVIDESNFGEALYSAQRPQEKEIELTAIPYCVWDNRESGEMRVWLRTTK
jgi:DUF1680 family protein